MDVKLAKSAGFCFGVEKAVKMVYDEAKKSGEKVYTLGPIIHNSEVVKDMEKNGVSVIDENDSLHALESGSIVIRSHGVGKNIYDRCKDSNLKVVDATCPYVKKIHRIVERECEKGNQVIIIGNPTHPEVEGIRGWGNENTFAIDSIEEFEKKVIDKNKKISIVAQTTFNHKKFKELIDKITSLGYDIDCFNTICNATQERQVEAADIASKVDTMIVIGDKKSSNTGKLVEICQNECENTIFIQTVDDLETTAFPSVSSVGITAGASTPKHIIEEVQNNVRSKF